MQGQGPKVEASTLSRSTSKAVDAANRKDIINAKTSFVDSVFPLADETLKTARIPQGPYTVLALFVCLEILVVSYWSQFDGYFDYSRGFDNVLKYFFMICFFCDLSDSDISLTIRFVIMTIVTVLFWGMLITQGAIYSKNRRFVKWTLTLTRFFIEFFPVMCLVPLGNFIGQTFHRMVEEGGTLPIVYFVLSLIYLVCFLFAHYLESNLWSSTIYLSEAPIACWSGYIHFIFIVGVSFFPMLAWVVQEFSNWMKVAVMVIKLVFNGYMLFELSYLPFVQASTNTLVAVVFSTASVLDIMAIVKFFVAILPMYNVIAMFIAIIVTGAVWKFAGEAIVKKVKANMQREALEDIEVVNLAAPVMQSGDQFMVLKEEDKRQLFLNCGIQRSTRKAELYMKVGLSTQCPLFYDWSLAKFVSEFHAESTRLTCLITQMLALFPCESRLLNYFFGLSANKLGLKVGDRFMLYQVHRVSGLRQSSASSEITEKLMAMKALSSTGCHAVRSFWEQVPRDPSVLYDIRVQTLATKALFDESLVKWPNNCRLCDDYSNYLIECATDFNEGLIMKHRAELIEQGKNFVIDLSFRSLVANFPMYLKRGIMDVKGYFVSRQNAKGGMARGSASMSLSGSSSNGGSQMSTGTMDGQLDNEIEDQLGRVCFSNHRMRLGYQRALANRKSTNNQKLRIMSVIAMLAAAALIIFLFVYYYNIFQSRADNMEIQGLLNHFRYGFDAAVVTIVFHWARRSQLISDTLFGDSKIGLAIRSPKTNNNNLQFNEVPHQTTPAQLARLGMTQKDYNMFDETQRWVTWGKDNLEQFASKMVLMASESSSNVHVIMNVMINQIVELDFCDGDGTFIKPMGTKVNETLKTAVAYELIELANMSQAKFTAAENYYHLDKGLCECLTNVKNVYAAFDQLTESISGDQANLKQSMTKENHIMLIGVCCAYVVVIAPSLFVFLTMTLKELRTLLTMMCDLDKASREEAAQPFKQTATDTQETLDETKGNQSISAPFFYGNVIFFCVVAIAVFIIVIMMAEMKNSGFLELNRWLFYGISRANYMLESLCFAVLNILLVKHPGVTQMVTQEYCEQMSRSILANLISYNTKILRGGDDLRACTGQNARLDQIHFADDCHGNLNMGGFHDIYRCASLDRGINLFNVLVTELLDQPENVSLELDQPFYHSFHLMNDHMIDNTYEASEILTELAGNSKSSFQVLITAVAFGGIVVLLLAFTMFLWNLRKLDTAFDGALQLLRRLPPLSVVSNVGLLNYLLNKNDEKTDGKMTVSKSVIINTKDAVLCLNRQESIEVVNKSVSLLFGYTPEQLLGQPFSSILNAEENVKLFEQTQLMRNGEAPLTYEDHCIGTTDDEQRIPVSVTVLGVADGGKSAQSFVAIMRDETQLRKQQQEAETAKKQSEDLLYQILPRAIVVRLNHGEQDISFVVPSATVVFVDIVKFSDYAATLTPAQIMENLSMVFAGFDHCCAQQPLMTKIKLIGDVYMAAANLFTPNEPASAHAAQVVQFGLECLNALEEVNTQLDASLQVRIGVNTDGPLIAGVLGTDKPVFDIIGDTINVSARLQSTGIPGTVQISQFTYDALAGQNFNIEPRGEIFLKGKGKKMAYVVRPLGHSSFFAAPESSGNW